MSMLGDRRGPLEEHLGERASAYLDGELDASERAAADAHLAGCPACRAAMAGERAVRDAVRALGPVDPPPGFLDGVLARGPQASAHARVRRRRRVPFGLAQLAATAAVWIVILGFGINRNADGVAPDTDGYVTAHAAAAANVMTGGGASTGTNSTEATGTTTTPTTIAPTGAAPLPSRLGDFVLVERRVAPGAVQAVYSRGDEVVSVFVQAGMLNPRALGRGAERVNIGGLPGYWLRWRGNDVLVFQRGAAVYTVVTPSMGDVDRVPPDLPATRAPSPSLGDRFRAAADGLTDCFGLAG